MIVNNSFDLPRRIESIQILRFLAAICIAFSHFSIVSSFEHTSNAVSFCLNFFFALSGFIVMLSTKNEIKKKGFFVRRLIRLVPLYWILTIATFAVAQFSKGLLGYIPTVEHLLKSLFFIPFTRTALKSANTIRPIVGLGHTLQMEVFFAVIFMLCMKISHKYRGLISGCVLIGLAIIGKIVPFENTILKFYINRNYLALLSFAVGIGCYYILRFMQNKSMKNKLMLLFSGIGGAFAIAAWGILSICTESNNLGNLFLYLTFGAMLIFATAYSSAGGKAPNLLVKLGDASFSFYLIHYFVISVAERVLRIDSFSLANAFLIIVIVMMCWVISYLSYLIIEKRFGGWLTHKYNKLLEKRT